MWLDCFILKEKNQRFSGFEISKLSIFRPKKGSFWQSMSLFLEHDLEDDKDGAFSEAFESNNAEKCLEIYKQENSEKLFDNFQLCIMRIVSGENSYLAPCDEMMTYLISPNKLIQRAERELTLGRLEIERKFAIGIVYQWLPSLEYSNSLDLIKGVIETEKLKLNFKKNQLNQLRDMNAPSIIIRSEEKMLSVARYSYLCVFQNRRWLERYFSN
ncbi:MAG: hypothetical protein FJZ43_02810 [Candidatus Staskawiczbacteria bacterium]|nr:hypothetical protein [Candidatus Staskawiczbacteria bacterium]